jgi:hypothetical protein
MTKLLAAAIGLAIAAGCGGSSHAVAPATEAEHLALAQQHAQKARAEQSQYDPRATVLKPGGPAPNNQDLGYMEREVNPTDKHLRRARRERRAAEAHVNAARRIEAYGGAACTSIPAAERAACPLIIDARVEDVAGGVRIHVASDLDGTLERVRCHLAFAEQNENKGQDECPLYVHGARATPAPAIAGAAVDALDLTTNRPELVAELRRRAREHVAE